MLTHSTPSHKPHYVILGGGISGLALAWFLQKNYKENIAITIIEKEKHCGGHIHTIEHDGFLFEQGPRGCRTKGTGRDTLELIEALSLQDQAILADPAANKKYRWIDQEMQPLPTGFLSLIFSPLFKDLLSAAFLDWKTPPCQSIEDETIYQFISRRLGVKIAETLFDPLTSGIYAGDIKRLSMKSCFSLLHQWEQQHGSLLKGMFSRSKRQKKTYSPFVEKTASSSTLFSLRDGMQQLTDTIATHFQKNILLNTWPTKLVIPKNPEEKIDLHLQNQKIIHADKLFSTISSQALGSLLIEHDPTTGRLLKEMNYTSLAVVNLGYHQQVNRWKGFGYLIPSAEKEDNLGVVWDSCVFPQQNKRQAETRLTVMIGGEHMPHFDHYNIEEFEQIALRSLNKQMNLSVKPEAVTFKIIKKAIPQYECGHAKRVETIQKGINALSEQLICVGSWISGASVNDCIAFAKEIAEKKYL